MTAANEKLLPCPFCGGTNIDHKPSTGIYCATCEIWYGVMNASKASLVAAWNRRAQTADLPIAVGVDMSRGDDMTARAYLYEGGIMYVEYEPPSQPAAGVDERAIAESAWEAGYISAQQDERYPPAPPLPDHVFEMIMANARAMGGK